MSAVLLLRCLALLCLPLAGAGWAEETETREPVPVPPWRQFFSQDQAPVGVIQVLAAQGTFTTHRLLPFAAPYTGPLSLTSGGDTHSARSLGLYLGVGLTERLQAYLDLEYFNGAGVSRTTGLAGLTNADVIRQGSGELGQGPYVARRYLRYVLPLGGESLHADRAQDQLPGLEPSVRLEIKLGTLALGDDFDRNRYANSARTQFMNWSFFNNLAWDYAADTRGYSDGLMLAWAGPEQALRLGLFKMPSQANGQDLDLPTKALGTNLEWTFHPGAHETIVRLLAFHNRANMGVYRHAMDLAQGTGAPPSISADDRPGRSKFGAGLNFEQPLADDGETGLFGRLGWNNGKTESFAYTEADRHFSMGAQVAGSHWRRPADRLGVALAVSGLSGDHRRYLEAGGMGFVLGDGKLRYAPEEIVEAYYRIALGRSVQIGPDVQYLVHPGYNADRGPGWAVALRLHVEY